MANGRSSIRQTRSPVVYVPVLSPPPMAGARFPIDGFAGVQRSLNLQRRLRTLWRVWPEADCAQLVLCHFMCQACGAVASVSPASQEARTRSLGTSDG